MDMKQEARAEVIKDDIKSKMREVVRYEQKIANYMEDINKLEALLKKKK